MESHDPDHLHEGCCLNRTLQRNFIPASAGIFLTLQSARCYTRQMLTYLEDFVEYIAGIRDRNGHLVNSFTVSNVRLANYDHNIVHSLGSQTAVGTSLTDRQYQLASKIVHKYRRQLGQQGITVPDPLALRMPLRVVDRSSTLSYDANEQQFYLRFPYNANIIDSLREFSNVSCGRVVFDNERRAWIIGASLPNLVYISNWAREHNFTVAFDVDQLLEEFYNNTQVPVLKFADSEQRSYAIDNDPGSMELDLVNQEDIDILAVLNQASAWQVAVDPEVVKCARDRGYRDQWIEWSMKRMLHIRPEQDSIEDFFAWVNTLSLWPVIWHSSDTEDIGKIESVLGEGRVVTLHDKRSWNRRDPVADRLVFFSPVLAPSSSRSKYNGDVGVLVTKQSIMYQIKNIWGSRSRKLVYWGDKILTELR